MPPPLVQDVELELRAALEVILEAARDAFYEEFGYESSCPSKVRFLYSREGIPQGKAAWWEPASAWNSEEVRLDPGFHEPYVALVHEAIHVVLNSPCSGVKDTNHHGEKFHALADRMGLPDHFRE